jgi:hypothetical protein
MSRCNKSRNVLACGGREASFPARRKGRSFIRELPAGCAEVLLMNGSRNAVGGNATSSFDPSVKLNSQREYTRARARFKYQGGIK